MGKLVNRAKMTVSAVNNGASPPTVTLGSASSGFQAFSTAGVADGDIISYVIEDGTSWEIGQGTYSSTGPTLSRTTIQGSSNNGSAISATTSASVFVSSVASDTIKTRTVACLSSVSYTPKSDVVSFLVCITGAGSGRAANSGGVGGTGYTEKYYSSGFKGNTYTVTIGAAGGSAAQGGTTSFQLSGSGPSVVAPPVPATDTGGTGGTASGGDVNFTGGTGGNNVSGTAYGGGGGPATRAGAGGNGAAASGSTGGGGGGTGGNNASGSTGGSSTTTLASGVYKINAIPYEAFFAGGTASGSAGGNGAASLNNATAFGPISFEFTANTGAIGTNQGATAGGSSATSGTVSGKVIIVEFYQ